MAQYHIQFQYIGRKSGGSAAAGAAYSSGSRVVSGSAVAAAAYRGADKLRSNLEIDDETKENKVHDYTIKRHVVYSEVMLPESAPESFYDRQTLWNAVEAKNKRKDAILVRECNLSLPHELTLEQQIEQLREFSDEGFVKQGRCVDFSIHDDGKGNPHAHMLFTLDEVTEKGVGKRLPQERAEAYLAWKENQLLYWRKLWADVTNKHLEKAGFDERVDHRSYKAQGINKIPMRHMGKEATQLEKKGIKTERGNYNRQVRGINENLKELDEEIRKLNSYIFKLSDYKDQPGMTAKINYLKTVSEQKAEYAAKEFVSHLEEIKQLEDGKSLSDISTGDETHDKNLAYVMSVAWLVGKAEEGVHTIRENNDQLKNIEAVSPPIEAQLRSKTLKNEVHVLRADEVVQQTKLNFSSNSERILNRLKSEYTIATRELKILNRQQSEYKDNEPNFIALQTSYADLNKRLISIRQTEHRISELQRDRKKLPLLNVFKRYDIQKQIKALQLERLHAENALGRAQGLTPSQALNMKNRMHDKILNIQSDRNAINNRQLALEQQMGKIELEYKSNLLVGNTLMPEGQLRALFSPHGKDKQNIKISGNQKLDVITPDDYLKITGKVRSDRLINVPKIGQQRNIKSPKRYKNREEIWER